MRIPNSKPYFSGKENVYIAEAISRSHISGDGWYTEQVEGFIRRTFNAYHVLMTTSGTHALEMAALLIGLKPGDEVILPSFTFSTTACAVMLRGAHPVFAEIKKSTLNIDPRDVKDKITSKTRAIICVHYAGIGCDMDEILAIAKQHDLYVIEDAAQGVNAKYNHKYLGTIGDFGCYSFHGTKNYTCGEGGALIINPKNQAILERAEAIRNKGTNRSQFLRGDIDKYTWTEVGSSYTPSEILMAHLFAQFSVLEEIQRKRKAIYGNYHQYMQVYEAKGILRTLQIPEECEPNYHLFCVLFNEEAIRDKVMGTLRNRGIEASIHYLPLHSSPLGQQLGYAAEDLPITEQASRCLLRLPMYAGLTEQEQEYVMDIFKGIFI